MGASAASSMGPSESELALARRLALRHAFPLRDDEPDRPRQKATRFQIAEDEEGKLCYWAQQKNVGMSTEVGSCCLFCYASVIDEFM